MFALSRCVYDVSINWELLLSSVSTYSPATSLIVYEYIYSVVGDTDFYSGSFRFNRYIIRCRWWLASSLGFLELLNLMSNILNFVDFCTSAERF